jgi:hypothetical protein
MSAKQKSAAELRQELTTAQADLVATQARAAELENAGKVDTKTVSELATLNARAQLLRGAIRRLLTELPTQERIEAQAEIERLQAVVSRENAAADKEAARLTVEACKILLPDPDSHKAWTHASCERRRHEIGLFATEHPAARNHTDAARNAKAEIERLQKMMG